MSAENSLWGAPRIPLHFVNELDRPDRCSVPPG